MLVFVPLITIYCFLQLISCIEIKNKKVITEIVGGQEATGREYLYTAGLRTSFNGKSFCGGAVIAPNFILTAAHCDNNLKFVVGKTHLIEGNDGEIREVKKVTRHPLYNKENRSFDIAVVELFSPLEVFPVLLLPPADGSAETPGRMASATGWGFIVENSEPTTVLHQVDLEILPTETCKKVDPLDNSMLCAGNNGKDTCQGDSGGPLVIHKEDAEPIVVGIVSWGIGCGHENHPGIYSRVSKSIDFIEETVRKSLNEEPQI